MLRRAPTGIVGLDRLLNGGLPTGSWTLVVGPPGSAKSTLGRQFLYTAASKDWAAILLSTCDPREIMMESMLSFGWNAQDIDRIELIDCYSWKQGVRPSIDIRNLTETSITITQFFDERQANPEKNLYLVIDSFTDFLLNNDANAAVRFLGQLKSKLRERGVTTLVLLEEGVHEDEIVLAAEYFMDGTIHTKFDPNGRYIMVSRMVATPLELGWSEFAIQKGIDLVVADFFGGARK